MQHLKRTYTQKQFYKYVVLIVVYSFFEGFYVVSLYVIAAYVVAAYVKNTYYYVERNYVG